MPKKSRNLRLSERTWSQLEKLASWLQVENKTRVVEVLAEMEYTKMKAADFRYCARCGAEYNALRGEHECDPRVLATLAQEEQDDAEVREREGLPPRPAQPRPNPDYR